MDVLTESNKVSGSDSCPQSSVSGSAAHRLVLVGQRTVHRPVRVAQLPTDRCEWLRELPTDQGGKGSKNGICDGKGPFAKQGEQNHFMCLLQRRVLEEGLSAFEGGPHSKEDCSPIFAPFISPACRSWL